MRTVVINTGTEILLGDVINTHLAFIAQEIFPLGLRVTHQIAVPDGPAIGRALRALFPMADLIFVTGGLGPTTDDVTREIVADLLQLPLRADKQIEAAIRDRLVRRNVPMTDRVLRQADLPQGAEVLPNENGTAPGLYLRENINPAIPSPHLFVLPGPPRELRPMFLRFVLPMLQTLLPAGAKKIAHGNYRMAGMGESIVERAVGDKLLRLPGIEIGYCARVGEVDLRIIGEPASVTRADEIIRAELGDSIFSREKEELEVVLVHQLAARGATIVTAESCTGGLLAHRLTNVSGASAVFLAGFVTYSSAAKSNSLGIAAELIGEHGAVSEPVARAMAENARAAAQATYALATTGIAGPAGGSQEKPAGTVFVALATDAKTIVRRFYFPNDRETFKQMTAQAAFNLLREELR